MDNAPSSQDPSSRWSRASGPGNQFLQQGRMPRCPGGMKLPIFPGEGGAPASCPGLLARPCPNRQERTAPGLTCHAVCLRQAEDREKPAEAVSAWGWRKARSEIPEASAQTRVEVTAQTRVEFTDFSPVFEVKRTDFRRSRGRP